MAPDHLEEFELMVNRFIDTLVCFKILARTENFRYTVSSDVHVNLEGWEFVSTYCICFSKDYYMYFSMESEFVNQKAINNKSLL